MKTKIGLRGKPGAGRNPYVHGIRIRMAKTMTRTLRQKSHWVSRWWRTMGPRCGAYYKRFRKARIGK